MCDHKHIVGSQGLPGPVGPQDLPGTIGSLGPPGPVGREVLIFILTSNLPVSLLFRVLLEREDY